MFPCTQVREAFTSAFATLDTQCYVFPQGCNFDVEDVTAERRAALGRPFRARLGLSADDILVLGSGNGDFRKGIDLFVQVAREIALSSATSTIRKIVFAWAGPVERNFQQWVEKDVTELGLSERLIFLGQQRDVAPCFASSDIFFLPSREDPFATVVLEAMASGVPVVGFLGSGGFEEQARGGAGLAVPLCRRRSAAGGLEAMADQPDERARRWAALAGKKIAQWGDYRAYVTHLIDLMGTAPATSDLTSRNSLARDLT